MTSFSYDEIAEKSVLGVLLLGDQSAMVNVKTSLSRSDFIYSGISVSSMQ